MTNDEGTWSWWCIMWATEGAVFRKASGAASHATDEPEPWANINQPIKDAPTGGINHQNTCGHGFTWRERWHMAETTVPLNRGTASDGPYASRGKNSGNTLMGASPAEVRFRDYDDHQKRWSSK